MIMLLSDLNYLGKNGVYVDSMILKTQTVCLIPSNICSIRKPANAGEKEICLIKMLNDDVYAADQSVNAIRQAVNYCLTTT